MDLASWLVKQTSVFLLIAPVYTYIWASSFHLHASGHHLPRSDRVCSHCGGVPVADELHMVFECPALALIRQNYAELFTPATDSMRFFLLKMHTFRFSCLY